MSFLSSILSVFQGSKEKRVNLSKRFELIARTGQGSMSKVWRARDRATGKIVCVKVLDRVKTARFEDRFKGLKRPSEGMVCMSLRHRNIVQTYECGISTEREQFLVMELIEGVGMNYLVETHSATLPARRLDYLIQSTRALEHAHQQGFLHRDMCPRNIMVNQEGVVKLIDFGLAIPNLPQFTRAGNRTGTTAYLAPELIRRKPTDHRVDLFALGVTAYEMFTHDHPWERTHSLEMLRSHMNNPGKDPRTFVPDMDDATAAFLIKSIHREPDERFQTATEFREALQALQQSAE